MNLKSVVFFHPRWEMKVDREEKKGYKNQYLSFYIYIFFRNSIRFGTLLPYIDKTTTFERWTRMGNENKLQNTSKAAQKKKQQAN